MRSRAAISRESVLAAIAECDRLGRDTFLARYGYQRSKSYLLEYEGREYDTKAILGVAFGVEYGCAALRPGEFSGGAEHCARTLVRLGFAVHRGEESLTARILAGAKRLVRRVARTIAALTSDTREFLVGLVGCTKAKLEVPGPDGKPLPLPARELYSPSYVFKRSVEYLKRRCVDAWYVLSAKHGLVEPDELLAPYNETLSKAPRRVVEAWNDRVRAALRERLAGRRVKFILMAGESYAGAVVGLGAEVEEPLKGLSTGHRRSWLAAATSP